MFGSSGASKIGLGSLYPPKMMSKRNFEARNEFSTSKKHNLDTKIMFLSCLESEIRQKPVSGSLPGVPVAPLDPYGFGMMSIVYFDVFNGFLVSKNLNNKNKFAQIQPLMTEICP